MTRLRISRAALAWIASLALAGAASAQAVSVGSAFIPYFPVQVEWGYQFEVFVSSKAVLHDLALTYTTPPNTVFYTVWTPSGATCSTPAMLSPGTVHCTASALQVGQGSPFVSISVVTKVPGFVSHSASVTYAGATAPMTAGPREMVVGGGPLQFTSIVATSAAKAGSDEMFDITLTNTGATPQTGTFELDVPAGGAFVGTSTPGLSCVASIAGTTSCTLPTLAAGAQLHLQMLTRLPPTAGVVTYTVALRLPVWGRVRELPKLVAVTPRDVQLTSQVLPASPIAELGSDTTVTLRVKNLGTDESTPITVTAVVPPSLTVHSVSSTAGTCAAPPLVGCNGIVLAGGASADVTFVARAANSFATATVTASATSLTANAKPAEAHIVIGDNTATTTATALTPDRSTASSGKPLTYKATVTNSGAGDAYTLKTQIVLTSGGSITSAVGDGFTCAVQQYAVDCETPLLARGATALATVNVIAPPEPVTTVSLSATTSALNAPTQSVLVTTPIGGSQRDVAVAVQESVRTAIAGQRTPIHFDVTNPSSADADNVTLDASLTPGLMLDSIATTVGSCVAAHCSLGTLKAGAKETVTVTVVAVSAGAQNVGAAITCDAQESTSANDAAAVSINVTGTRSRGVRH
ncbi:MAG TPA: hypothetical protein VHU41_14335 [Thermoanaerobaculia bacterium]|jgi:uncharacterized repeat protein (TIGR01451 family)|nr:hypothetical protein [Thermoanaerobaculia bacterium]